MCDFHIQNEGSLFILWPLTEAAEDWADAHLPEDATRWAKGYVVEHRYISAIVDGIQADGLVCE